MIVYNSFVLSLRFSCSKHSSVVLFRYELGYGDKHNFWFAF